MTTFIVGSVRTSDSDLEFEVHEFDGESFAIPSENCLVASVTEPTSKKMIARGEVYFMHSPNTKKVWFRDRCSQKGITHFRKFGIVITHWRRESEKWNLVERFG